jgi:hypothetical protein
MEPRLLDPQLDVYLTWDVERLPAYGDRVVAVLLGDEGARIPRYTPRVRAVFKAYGVRPQIPGRLRDAGARVAVAQLLQQAVRWGRWIPGGAAHARERVARRLRGAPPPGGILTIPLGTFNQVDLPVLTMPERTVDVAFAGSVEHSGSWRQRVASPKVQARREMLAAVRALAGRRPGLVVDLRVTSSFKASEATPAAEYSASLVAARVCLAPRGTSAETFRVLEGLRAGCVVIADRLPPRAFYDGSPVVQLDRWDRLAEVVEPLLADPAALGRCQAAGLAWWRERCSEEAVGAALARRLNALGQRGAGQIDPPRGHLTGGYPTDATARRPS